MNVKISCLCDLTEFQTEIGNIDKQEIVRGEQGTPRGVGLDRAWLEIKLRLRRRYRGSKFKEVSSRIMISLEC